MELVIKVEGSDDKRLKRAIKQAICPLLSPKREWIVIEPATPPDPEPWDWNWKRHHVKYGYDILVSDLDRIIGYTSTKNYNTYLIEEANYVWKYKITKPSTIMKHLKADVRLMMIVIEE